jgi:hypothetical protein
MSPTLQFPTEVTVPLDDLFFAQPMLGPPRDIGRTHAKKGKTPLPVWRDDLLIDAAGNGYGCPESFATQAARDAALGVYGRVRFIAKSWPEVQATGFFTSDIAIGHRFGEEGFDRVATPVVGAVISDMERTGELGAIVIARIQYKLREGWDYQIIVDGGVPQFGVDANEQEIAATTRWLQETFAERLAMPPTITI